MLKIDRSSDFVMDSAISYYKKQEPKLPYIAGQLFLDNGAYTANMQNIELDIAKIIFIQEKLNPTKTIPLDHPFKSRMSGKTMKNRWKKTAENIIFWQSSTKLNRKLVPSLHAWSKDSLKQNLLWLQKFSDSDYLEVGSIVGPEFTTYTGFFGDRQPNKGLIDMLSLILSIT